MTLDKDELKAFISEDTSRIELILEQIGCHDIWDNGDELRCATPTGTNKTSISVNKESLLTRLYSEGQSVNGDIFELVKHYRKENFSSSLRFVRALLGLSSSNNVTNKIDPLRKFKQIAKASKVPKTLDEIDVKKYGISYLDRFAIASHLNLFYEGITPQTQELFMTGYDQVLDRIVFPHFNYDNVKDIVGISGRTLRSKMEMEEFDIPKYWNYIRGYKKAFNLYGFSHALEYIEKAKMIVIFEAEKSVLKQFSMTRNEGYSVAVGCHDITDIQVQIILAHTSPDVEIVIAFDRDVQDMKDEDKNEIGEEYLLRMCGKFSKYRTTSYIWDKFNILGDKDSPVDKGVKAWNYLLKYRKKA